VDEGVGVLRKVGKAGVTGRSSSTGLGTADGKEVGVAGRNNSSRSILID
jgi:hypothetical protein